MGAKISKFASIKVATQCSVAFSKVMKWCKKQYKKFSVHENVDEMMNYLNKTFKKVVCVYNLQRCFYPLDENDYINDECYYYGMDWCKKFVRLSIDCIHPLMLNYAKLDNHSCVTLINTMKNHLYALIYEDLGVQKVYVG